MEHIEKHWTGKRGHIADDYILLTKQSPNFAMETGHTSEFHTIAIIIIKDKQDVFTCDIDSIRTSNFLTRVTTNTCTSYTADMIARYMWSSLLITSSIMEYLHKSVLFFSFAENYYVCAHECHWVLLLRETYEQKQAY